MFCGNASPARDMIRSPSHSSSTEAASSTVTAALKCRILTVISDFRLYSHATFPGPRLARARCHARSSRTGAHKYVFDFVRLQDMGDLRQVLGGCYGSQAAALAHMPRQLLADASEKLVRGLPEILVLKSEKKPPLIDDSNEVSVETLEVQLGKRCCMR
ncbi:hypothetical protein V8D89_004380 [Ganoderma adspersum]